MAYLSLALIAPIGSQAGAGGMWSYCRVRASGTYWPPPADFSSALLQVRAITIAMTHYHLVYERSNWTLKREGSDKAVAVYYNFPKGDAIQKAGDFLCGLEAILVIHKSGGGISEHRLFSPSKSEPAISKAIPMPEMSSFR